jgi:beta-carotene hydroxylase
MLPRNPADYRSLLWALAMPLVALAHYLRPDLSLYLLPLGCYLSISAGVMAHNHNHCPTFRNRRMNGIYGAWLSIFYGYPTFGWIPTHNLNHHKFVNRAGDATITWRHTDKHNALVALTYFFVSAYWQSGPIKEFIQKAKAKNPALYRSIIGQYVFWIGTYVAVFAASLAVGYHHAAAAGEVSWGSLIGQSLWRFTLAFAIPGFTSLWTIMFFNYAQHVHADPWSEHNHSRNFTGKLLNFLLFNNGLHTVHHEHPGVHWSTAPALHAKIEHEIHPELKQPSLWPWIVKTYFLAPFIPSLGTQQIGRAAYDDPAAEKAEGPATAEVYATEAGDNAAMV